MWRVVRGFLLLAIGSALCFASDNSAPKPGNPANELPDAPSQSLPATADNPAKASRTSKVKKLLLGATRQHGIVNGETAAPMTASQKFHLFSRTSVSPYRLIAVGVDAGVSQATDEFPEYGQGMEGYGKRYGASLADDVSSRFFGKFVFPVLLKEDPRYFRLGTGPMKKRIFYALAQEFVAHRDDGGRGFNFSNPLGAVTAGALSNTYYPPADRGFGLTMRRAGVSLAIGSGNGVLKEFWPDIRRKLLPSKRQSRH